MRALCIPRQRTLQRIIILFLAPSSLFPLQTKELDGENLTIEDLIKIGRGDFQVKVR